MSAAFHILFTVYKFINVVIGLFLNLSIKPIVSFLTYAVFFTQGRHGREEICTKSQSLTLYLKSYRGKNCREHVKRGKGAVGRCGICLGN